MISHYAILENTNYAKSCNSDSNLRNECATCNKGYYLASDSENKTFCENCNKIKECAECFGDLKYPICIKCKEGFRLENNLCIEETCDLGIEDKCKTCKNEIGRKKECSSCNDGYYLEENKISYKCSKCSIKNCKKCSIELGYEVCHECKNDFILIKDDNEISYSCICPTYYQLTENNTCKKTGNWVEAEYNIDIKFKGYILHKVSNTFNLNEIEAYINNTKIQRLIENVYVYYKFSKSGIYKILINFNKILYDMSYIFNVDTLTKLKFLPGFDSSKVIDMSSLFSGSNIEYLDLYYLKTDNVINMNDMFFGSRKLISLDMSKFNTSNLQNMREMFFLNEKLYQIDFSSFDTTNVKKCELLFDVYQKNLVIKISNKFTNCREFIPIELKVINVDEILCKNIEHCKECIGSKENLSCAACELGYDLKENKCILPNCIIGENEKCHNCNFQKENECLSCNIGYYLPTNSKNKSTCTKCKIEGCEICNKNDGNCEKCQIFYKPIKDEYTSKIIFCKKLCEYGDGNKCASCNENQENNCLSCNSGYKLMKNGTCIKIDNSFVAVYNVTSTSEYVKILKFDVGNWLYFHSVESSDFEAFINGTKIKFDICYYNHYFCYKFQKTGLIEIKISIKKSLSTLRNFFEDCEKLVSVKFSEAFDTSNVLNAYSMFKDCTSLKGVDISPFNTSLISHMTWMFSNCYELTSIDLSNFDTRNVLSFQEMFQNNYKLNYVDISSFNTSKSYVSQNADYFFKGVTGKGTIIINKKTYNKDIPSGWNVIYKDY